MTAEFRPGDIWRHSSMGRLAVTGESGCKPGYLKCYWMMAANKNAPWTCMDPTRTKGFTLVSRMGTMADLSPAAQAVMDAFLAAPMGHSHVDDDQYGLAAALRAAALYCKRDSIILLSLADELEGLQGIR